MAKPGELSTRADAPVALSDRFLHANDAKHLREGVGCG